MKNYKKIQIYFSIYIYLFYNSSAKEQEILKIEEEKHRVRERELGKNYLLDAYLNTKEKPAETTEEQRQRIAKFPTGKLAITKVRLGNYMLSQSSRIFQMRCKSIGWKRFMH